MHQRYSLIAILPQLRRDARTGGFGPDQCSHPIAMICSTCPGFTCREWFPDITLDGRAALEAHCLPQRWSGVMDTSLVPEAKPLILCNDVVVDPANGNAHLVAVFNAIRPSSRPAY